MVSGALGLMGAIGAIPGYFWIADLAHCMTYHPSPDGDGTDGNMLPQCGSPWVTALGAALLAAIVGAWITGRFARARLRGRSDAAPRVTAAMVAAAIVAGDVAWYVALIHRFGGRF
jgi:hypothetical protein